MTIGLKPLIVFLLLIYGFVFFLVIRFDNPVLSKNSSVSVTQNNKTIDSDSVLMYAQQWRSKNGLPEYQQSNFLCEVANIRVEEIKSDFSHNQFSADRFCSECEIGENIQITDPSMDESHIFARWVSSKDHLKLLRKNYSHTCIRASDGAVVQLFGYY